MDAQTSIRVDMHLERIAVALERLATHHTPPGPDPALSDLRMSVAQLYGEKRGVRTRRGVSDEPGVHRRSRRAREQAGRLDIQSERRQRYARRDLARRDQSSDVARNGRMARGDCRKVRVQAMTLTHKRVVPDAPAGQPTIDQVRDHVTYEGGFISRGDALALLQFTNDERSLVRFAWLIDDFGRWQKSDQLERPYRRYNLAEIAGMIALGDDKTHCKWRFANVKIEYT